jgi:hypothetical protein
LDRSWAEGPDDPADRAGSAHSVVSEPDSSLELGIERLIRSIMNPDPIPDVVEEEVDQKWAEMAGQIRPDRSSSPSRKQEGTGETVEAADGSARPSRGVNSNWGAADGLNIWEGYSDIESARFSGDDSPVETGGVGRFGGGVGVESS